MHGSRKIPMPPFGRRIRARCRLSNRNSFCEPGVTVITSERKADDAIHGPARQRPARRAAAAGHGEGMHGRLVRDQRRRPQALLQAVRRRQGLYRLGLRLPERLRQLLISRQQPGRARARPGAGKEPVIAVVSIALVLVALVALAAFGLVLVLARRLREVTERVNKFLPVSDGGLPDPGTPVPEFTSNTADGTPVSHADLAGPARLFAMLTTDCSSCHDQVPALRELDADHVARPLVLVIGPPEQRAAMVDALAGHA